MQLCNAEATWIVFKWSWKTVITTISPRDSPTLSTSWHSIIQRSWKRISSIPGDMVWSRGLENMAALWSRERCGILLHVRHSYAKKSTLESKCRNGVYFEWIYELECCWYIGERVRQTLQIRIPSRGASTFVRYSSPVPGRWRATEYHAFWRKARQSSGSS